MPVCGSYVFLPFLRTQMGGIHADFALNFIEIDGLFLLP